MKLITLLASILLSAQVFAASFLNTFYSPKYEIVSAGPICPPSPGGIRCMVIGTIVKIKAPLNGCLDKVEFFNSQVVTEGKAVKIFTAALAKFDKRNATVRCIKMPEDFRTITLPREDYSSFELEKLIIENY